MSSEEGKSVKDLALAPYFDAVNRVIEAERLAEIHTLASSQQAVTTLSTVPTSLEIWIAAIFSDDQIKRIGKYEEVWKKHATDLDTEIEKLSRARLNGIDKDMNANMLTTREMGKACMEYLALIKQVLVAEGWLKPFELSYAK